MPKFYINNNGVWQAMDAVTADDAKLLEGSSKQKVIQETLSKLTPTSNTVELQVNGGNSITTNARYEIPASELPANFLDEKGNIKKNVQLRTVFTVTEGEVELPLGEMYDSTVGGFRYYGVSAAVAGSLIQVATAGYGARSNAEDTRQLVLDWNALPLGAHTTHASASKCKVIATLSGETYTIQTA